MLETRQLDRLYGETLGKKSGNFDGLVKKLKENAEVNFQMEPRIDRDYEHDLLAWVDDSFVKINLENVDVVNQDELFEIALVKAKLETVKEMIEDVYPTLGEEAAVYLKCLEEAKNEFLGIKQESEMYLHKISHKRFKQLIVLVSLVLTSCLVKQIEPYGYATEKTPLEPMPAPLACFDISQTSGVMKEYGQTVQDDNQDTADRFTQFATEDYSGLGYVSCTVDSDCLSGVQTCEAGIVANEPGPGFCVPKK